MARDGVASDSPTCSKKQTGIYGFRWSIERVTKWMDFCSVQASKSAKQIKCKIEKVAQRSKHTTPSIESSKSAHKTR